jgi:hypothetical protein
VFDISLIKKFVNNDVLYFLISTRLDHKYRERLASAVDKYVLRQICDDVLYIPKDMPYAKELEILNVTNLQNILKTDYLQCDTCSYKEYNVTLEKNKKIL